MAITVRMVRIAARTTIGTQDFTVAGAGVCKAAIINVSRGTVNGSSSDGAVLLYGFAANNTGGGGVKQYCLAVSMKDQASSADSTLTRHVVSNTNCIHLLASDGTVDAIATASFITDGIQINWTDAPATALLVSCELWFDSGSDLSVFAGDFQGPTAIDGTTVVSAVGFTPDNLIVLGRLTASWNIPFNGAHMQIGFADRGAAIQQCCLTLFSVTNSASTNVTNWLDDRYVRCTSTGAAAIEITAFSGTGFTATARISAATLNYPYLALAYNGTCGHSVQVLTSPQSTGSKDVTGLAFKPQFVHQLTSGVDVIRSQRSASEGISPQGAGTLGVVGFTATEIFSSVIGDNDAEAKPDTESISIDSLMCRSDIKTTLHAATFEFFNADGWRLFYLVASTTARLWPTFVLGEFTGTPPVVPELSAWHNQEPPGVPDASQMWQAVSY